MYISKIDDLIDKIIDDFYVAIILKDKNLAKILKEPNFVKYQKEILPQIPHASSKLLRNKPFFLSRCKR